MPSSYSNFYPFNLEIPEPYDTAFIMDDADLQAMLSSPSFHMPTPTHTAHELPVSHSHMPAMRRARTHTAPACPAAEEGHQLAKLPTHIPTAHKSRWERSLLNEPKVADARSANNDSLPPRRRIRLLNVRGVNQVEENGRRLPSNAADQVICDLLSGRLIDVMVERSTELRCQCTTSATLTPDPSPSYSRPRERTSSGHYHHRMPSSSVKVRRRSISFVATKSSLPTIFIEGPTLDQVEMGNWV